MINNHRDGNRIKKIEVGTNANQTIYYIGNFIQVRNSSGVFNTTFYYDRDILVGEKRYDGNTYFYHPNHLGSTNLVTNSTGDTVETTSYDPYGDVVEGGTSRYLYTGKEKDAETNFEYYGARYYYPYMTRFIQCDSIKPDLYNPQALNCYSYVLNNPYKYVDPSGNVPVLAIPFIVGGVGFGLGFLSSVIIQGAPEGGKIDYGKALESGFTTGTKGFVGSFVVIGITAGAPIIVPLAVGTTGLSLTSQLASNLAAIGTGEFITNLFEKKEVASPIEKNQEEKLKENQGIGDNKKITIDNQIVNQPSQIPQRASIISTGSGEFGNSYIVRNLDGSYIIRTNVAGGHIDTSISNQDKNNQKR